MPTISSLLRSAAAAQKALRAEEDRYVAMQWDNSAQTQADFDAYSEYLNKRMSTASTGDKITYAGKLKAANRSFTSNEIQRETQAINFGTGDLQTKQNKVLELYDRAVANGDMNLAQNLVTTYQTIDMQIQAQQQAQQQAGQAVAGQLAAARSNSLYDWLDKAKENMNIINDIFRTSGIEDFSKEVAATTGQEDTGAGYFDTLMGAAQQVVGAIDTAIAAESDPANLRKFQDLRNDYVSGSKFELPGVDGKSIKVSIQDLMDQAEASAVGESVFRPVATANGTGFEKNRETGYVWGRDAQGNYRQIPLRDAGVPTKALIRESGTGPLKPGERTKEVEYKKLLEDAGIHVVSSGEGGITIRNTGNIPGFYGSPFPTGQDIRLTVGLDGKLQASDGQKLYKFAFDEAGKLLGLKQDLPSAINQVSGDSARFNNQYFAEQLRQDPNYFDRFSPGPGGAGLVGIVDQALAEQYRGSVANFANNSNVSLLPQFSAANTLQANAAPVQAQAPLPQMTMPAPLVQPAARTPVVQPALNPFNLPPVPNLRVVNTAPAPAIKVQPVQTPRITGVTSAPTFTGTLMVR